MTMIIGVLETTRVYSCRFPLTPWGDDLDRCLEKNRQKHLHRLQILETVSGGGNDTLFCLFPRELRDMVCAFLR